MKLKAFRIFKKHGKIVAGNPARNWMDMTNSKFAYGCLPLIIANELGWDIICQTSFKAIWNGLTAKSSILIEFKDPSDELNYTVDTHFGHGILTFHPGFLFRTESGQNLYVKGVPNYIKDAIQPLEGVIETDWLPFTFTMNWKFTRPNQWVEFNKGEPIARIFPYERGYIEKFNPVILPLSEDIEEKAEFDLWSIKREEHNQSLANPRPERKMEKDYFRGERKNGAKIDYHQKKINLKEFEE